MDIEVRIHAEGLGTSHSRMYQKRITILFERFRIGYFSLHIITQYTAICLIDRIGLDPLPFFLSNGPY